MIYMSCKEAEVSHTLYEAMGLSKPDCHKTEF